MYGILFGPHNIHFTDKKTEVWEEKCLVQDCSANKLLEKEPELESKTSDSKSYILSTIDLVKKNSDCKKPNALDGINGITEIKLINLRVLIIKG